jgi:hypothetical protein
MRLLTFLIFWIFLLCSCDPYQLVYIRNYSPTPIVVDVHLNRKYPHPKPTNVNSRDSLIEDVKTIYDIRFNNTLSIKNLNDSLYQAVLPRGSTSIMEPVCIGFPIQKIVIKSKGLQDSVIFSGKNHNIKYAKKKKLLQKASMATFVVNFGSYRT